MEFGLTETQRLLREELSSFVADEIHGENLDWDDKDRFPIGIYESLVEMGLLGLHLPDSLGGEALSAVTSGVVYETLGRGDVGLATLVLTENLVSKTLAEHGSDHHRETAAANARGETHLCFGLTEPGQGSDAQAIDTTATRDGDAWQLNGAKTAITGATLADSCLVYARIAESGDIGAFLVPLDEPGVEVQPYTGMGCAVSGWGQLRFDDVQLPPGVVVTDRDAFKIAMETFDQSRAWIGLYCLGAAQQTLDETEQYLVDRDAFGKPLAAYEGPQFQIAEHQTKLQCARLKCYETLWRADEGLPHTTDAAMAKWYAPEVSVDAIHECLVLHGHYGYSRDFGIEKRLRDTIGLEIGDGTPQIQKLIIARETFGREYLPYDR